MASTTMVMAWSTSRVNDGGRESSTTAIEQFPSPPLALPLVVEEGVTWDEVGVRHGRTGDGVWGLSQADAGFTTVHTVTGCAVEAVEPTGNRTVCAISSLDDNGNAWTWKVADGLGPIDIDGANRLWVN